jgi:DNA-directed RNA polymerase subunit RPC12/RpoP
MHTLEYEIDCTHCGCPDAEVEREARPGAWFADGIARCNNCRQTFSFRAPKEHAEREATVIYNPIRCPSCRSTDVPVTHTAAPVRYHRCRNCTNTFKSVEKAE